MPELIELPAPQADPRSQERYERERAALAAASKLAARFVDTQPDAEHLKTILGIAVAA